MHRQSHCSKYSINGATRLFSWLAGNLPGDTSAVACLGKGLPSWACFLTGIIAFCIFCVLSHSAVVGISTASFYIPLGKFSCSVIHDWCIMNNHIHDWCIWIISACRSVFSTILQCDHFHGGEQYSTVQYSSPPWKWSHMQPRLAMAA